MFDLAFIEDNISVFVAVAVITFAVQLLLCQKAKKTICKLIPIAVLVLSTTVFSILSAVVGGWDGISFFFAIFSMTLILVCSLACNVWLILRKISR